MSVASTKLVIKKEIEMKNDSAVYGFLAVALVVVVGVAVAFGLLWSAGVIK